jgi:hypothetical protein
MKSSFSQSSGVRFMTAIMESRRFVADHSAVVEEKVTTATTLEEVEALRDVWNSLHVDDIDSDIDYYMTVVRHADQVIRPHVVHIRQDGGADLLAVARLENLPVPFRFGYRRLGSATLRAIVVTFGGILGARNKYEEEIVLRHLMKDLDKGVADLILMRNVDVDSTLYTTALAATGWAQRAHAQPVSRRWMAVIPDSMTRFLETRSAKTRKPISAASAWDFPARRCSVRLSSLGSNAAGTEPGCSISMSAPSPSGVALAMAALSRSARPASTPI